MNVLRHPLFGVVAAALFFAGCGGGGLYDAPEASAAAPASAAPEARTTAAPRPAPAGAVIAGRATTQEAIDLALAAR